MLTYSEGTGAGAGAGFAPLQQKLHDLGWVVGQNLVIESRHAGGSNEGFAAAAEELVRIKVDVILPFGGPASLDAARNATKSIAIVAPGFAPNLAGRGIVQSLARPGGNITGLSFNSEEAPGKRLQLLKEAIPGLTRAGVFHEGFDAAQVLASNAEAGRKLGVKITSLEARAPQEFDKAFELARKSRVGAVLVHGTPMFVGNREALAGLLIKQRLPSMGSWNYFADSGMLMGYSPDRVDMARRTAIYVDKIFRGAKPADLPIELPTKYELAVNLKTARALKLKIPQSFLLRADRVIE